MGAVKIATGVVHETPTDLQKLLISVKEARDTWEDITPLARNEWICWIESAKLTQTRNRRLDLARIKISQGKRRPCCWPGCPHR